LIYRSAILQLKKKLLSKTPGSFTQNLRGVVYTGR